MVVVLQMRIKILKYQDIMKNITNHSGDIVIYQSEDGNTRINVNLQGETVWLSQQQMSELFKTDRTSISRHIKNIYKTEELDKKTTCAFFAQVQDEGFRKVTRKIPYII